MQFPRHQTLHLTHNEQKAYYRSIAEAVLDNNEFCPDEWVSEEQKQKAIESDDCWTLQWYPDTPIGFYRVSGADLDAVLKKAIEIQQEDDARRG